MKYPYLKDEDFLKSVDKQRLKEQFAKITILDWAENPVQDIIGMTTGGSFSLNGSSAMRRTANLNMVAPDEINNITNINNLISINKKVSVEIGIRNTTDLYNDYEMLWFPMGTYVIIQPTVSHSLNNTNISLQLKDKMCLLNGECGGTLPASVTFSEKEYTDENGQKIIGQPTMYQIIQEAVNHWGGEQLGKIIISDLDNRVKKVMRWIRDYPLYLYQSYIYNSATDNFTSNGKIFTINILDIGQGAKHVESIDKMGLTAEDIAAKKNITKYTQYEYNQDIGYILTDFIYPNGDLVGNIGDSVVSILDQIRNVLGNYEYFYDIEGNFIFREIKNYLNTRQATVELNNLKQEDYLVDQTKGKAVYEFDDGTLITSYTNNPQYSNIKNDFLVWGQRKDVNGKSWPIRYHLAIDKKPQNFKTRKVFQYTDPDDKLIKAKSPLPVSKLPTLGVPSIVYYNTTDKKYYVWVGKKGKPESSGYEELKEPKLVDITPTDWRTELYLQGTEAESYAINSNDYFVELSSEWPRLYDIWKGEFQTEYQYHPDDCNFFLDFIDTQSALGQFSVSNIGRRTKTVVDDKVNCLFAPEIPDLVLIRLGQDDTEDLRQECDSKGLNYTQISDAIYDNIGGGGYLNSAYDLVKNLLYEYTSYNESISLQAVPIYHLDVNSRIRVSDLESDISGEYMVNQITIPLDNSGTMSISATRILEKL